MSLDDSAQFLADLPPAMQAGLELLPKFQPIILLTRHSIRELVDDQGLSGYNLPLTEQGRRLASAWGRHFCAWTHRQFHTCLSSPITRCVDTAKLMLEGSQPLKDFQSQQPVIVKSKLLVEPGSFVQDGESLTPLFMQYGALAFINYFLGQQIAGMKHPIQGVRDILNLLYAHVPDHDNSILLAVSHDTILAVFLAIMQDERVVCLVDLAEKMEGRFVWFEGERFEESRVHWVWRGTARSRLISSFVVQCD
jgi:broad specificity phosphatase PhoE